VALEAGIQCPLLLLLLLLLASPSFFEAVMMAFAA
jgi:hypothetical protein